MEALPPVDDDPRLPVADRVERTVRDMVLFAAESPALVDACTVALISPSPDVAHLRDRIGANIHRRLTAAVGPGVDPRVVRVLRDRPIGGTADGGHGPPVVPRHPRDSSADAAALLVAGRTRRRHRERCRR